MLYDVKLTDCQQKHIFRLFPPINLTNLWPEFCLFLNLVFLNIEIVCLFHWCFCNSQSIFVLCVVESMAHIIMMSLKPVGLRHAGVCHTKMGYSTLTASAFKMCVWGGGGGDREREMSNTNELWKFIFQKYFQVRHLYLA